MALSKIQHAFISVTSAILLSSCANSTRLEFDDGSNYNNNQQYNRPPSAQYYYNNSSRNNSFYYGGNYNRYNSSHHHNHLGNYYFGHRNTRHLWEQTLYLDQVKRNTTEEAPNPGTYTAPQLPKNN